MTPAKANLTIYQGATFKKAFYWHTTVKPTKTSAPVDLTGCSVRMQIRPRHASNQLIHDLTQNSHIMIGGAALGEIIIDIPASVTETFSFQQAFYDIEVVFENGDVFRVLEGGVSLSLGITREGVANG